MSIVPTRQFQRQVSVSGDPAQVIAKATSFFASKGRIADDPEAPTSQYPKISGVVEAGFFNMNPTLVHIEVISAGDKSCTLLLSGSAKEGLIKQQSAEKAVGRVADFLKTIG